MARILIVSGAYRARESPGCIPGPRVRTRDPAGATVRSKKDAAANTNRPTEVTMSGSGGSTDTSTEVPTMDVASRADLLHETSGQHGAFEAVAPPHDWWDWYAAYMLARERGSTPEDASAKAGQYMAEVKHVVVPTDANLRGSP
jgi:hypothetical protein